MKKIVLIANGKKDIGYTYTEQAERLLIKHGFETCRYTAALSDAQEKAIFENAFAVLVLGGDGTILNASKLTSRYNLPILAVNLGRLGYIAQLEKNDLDQIPTILSSHLTIEERAMLSVTLLREGKIITYHDALLNDVVIGKMNACGMIELQLYANGKTVSHYRGDGLILATATGSTAYSMSAGGAVIDPTLRIIEVTPLAAHSLKARPTIFSETTTLEISIMPSSSAAAITFDGENTEILAVNDRIRVTVSSNTAKLIAYHNDFGRILYQKMSDL